MPKKAVFIRIVEETNETSFHTTALIKKNLITFSDPQGVWHQLTFEPARIQLLKKGEMTLSMTFELFVRHRATMGYLGKSLHLEIETQSMHQTPEGITLTYRLWDGEIELSQHTFELMFTEGAKL